MEIILKKIEYWLSIGLVYESGEVAYAGDSDEMIPTFISGSSYEDRYGNQDGLIARALILSESLQLETERLFVCFYTEYGTSGYSLDDQDHNRLLMKIDSGISEGEIVNMIKQLLMETREKSIKGVSISDIILREVRIKSEDTKYV